MFEQISDIAKHKFGLQLTESKRQLVSTKIQKRMEKLGIDTFDDYFELLQSSMENEEDEGLVSALTTNVTNFFREPHHFEMIGKEFQSRLTSKARSGEKIRLWCAGCSTGQETYSLVIKLFEVFPDIGEFDVKVLSTDIDPNVLSRAKRGKYFEKEMEGMENNLINRYFNKIEDTYQIDEKLIQLVTFGTLNLMDEFPMTGLFDIILCRNVAIYFDRAIQEFVWTRIYQRLTQHGLLMVGHSERVSGEASQYVENVGVTTYRRKALHNDLR